MLLWRDVFQERMWGLFLDLHSSIRRSKRPRAIARSPPLNRYRPCSGRPHQSRCLLPPSRSHHALPLLQCRRPWWPSPSQPLQHATSALHRRCARPSPCISTAARVLLLRRHHHQRRLRLFLPPPRATPFALSFTPYETLVEEMERFV
ncbi:putative cap-gly domain-containing protein [Sesbania bispinosa]|nr:putative cap-gly domain-containing protein [Sesbania bispinosa]